MLNFQSIIVISSNPENDLKNKFEIDVNQPHVDIEIYRPDPSIGINTIKEIISSSKHRPLMIDTKTVIIDSADKMTDEAQNALLKLLEEPPDYLRILLVTNNFESFLETVLSRCQIVRLSSSNTESKNESIPENTLKALCDLTPPKRLSHLPTTIKSKEQAMQFCQELIKQGRLILHTTPNQKNTANLKSLESCLIRLSHNVNPTIALSDTVLSFV